MRAPSLCCVFTVLLALPGNPALAKKIYKYTDAGGIVHFTDVRPYAIKDVQETPVSVERQSFVGLRIEGLPGHRQVRAYNRFAGPAEIELRIDGPDRVVTEPKLPLSTVLAANEERVLAQIQPAEHELGGQFELVIRSMPGDPHASAQDYAYRWPLADATAQISQGFGGSFSHTDEQSRYAVDISANEGTAVLAARDGVVMQIEDDYYGNGLDREKFGDRANLVRILHSDGSMAIYAHLSPESVCVQTGRHIYAGQKLGESGNTGFSTGPHLHFAVQLNRGMRLQSVPIRLLDARGAALPVAMIEASGSEALRSAAGGR